jgi:hypothetical protein
MWRAVWGATAVDAACGAAGVTVEGVAAGAAACGASEVPGVVLVVGAVADCAKPPVAAGIAAAMAVSHKTLYQHDFSPDVEHMMCSRHVKRTDFEIIPH